MKADNDNQPPRLLSKGAAAAYCGCSVPTFSKWVLAGIIPPAFSITRRWDRAAIDTALDKASGLVTESSDDAFDIWKRGRDVLRA
jgi:predicted DNA-binding transcriptional regulator AlpA